MVGLAAATDKGPEGLDWARQAVVDQARLWNS